MRNYWRVSTAVLLLELGPVLFAGESAFAPELLSAEPPGMMSVAAFLPGDHVTDGSVSYQQEIQQAIDVAARDGRTLVFPPMVYRVDESGLRLCSRLTLGLYGAADVKRR